MDQQQRWALTELKKLGLWGYDPALQVAVFVWPWEFVIWCGCNLSPHNVAHIRQSRPESGLGFQANVLKNVLRCSFFARKRWSERTLGSGGQNEEASSLPNCDSSTSLSTSYFAVVSSPFLSPSRVIAPLAGSSEKRPPNRPAKGPLAFHSRLTLVFS